MATAQFWSCPPTAFAKSRLCATFLCSHAQQRRSGRNIGSHLLTGLHSASSSRSLESSTGSDAATHDRNALISVDTSAAETQDDKQDVAAGANDSTAYVGRGAPKSSWDVSVPQEDDWQGQKPFSLKDVDWGLAGLLGVILFLSFGAYRVLNHFRVYHHQNRHPQPQVTRVTERPSSSNNHISTAGTVSSSTTMDPTSAVASPTTSSKSRSSRSRHKQDKASKTSSSSTSASPAFPAAAAALAAAEGSSVPADSGSASVEAQQITAGQFSSAAGSPSEPHLVSSGGASSPVSHDLHQQFDSSGPSAAASVPGAPQLSPLDAGFSSMPTPWSGTELSQLDLGALPRLPQGATQLPELPSIQVDPPAKAVSSAEVSSLPQDPSLPSIRERAHIAMRASGAAMEASQRAAAYSAAASSAASRAAEAAEQAAVAASAVQTALETAAEDAMAEAVKRMNRAVEMVADAESRAAAAAAMATAYQDISDTQAAAARAAADLPAMPAKQTPQGHIANLRKVLHEQLFDTGAVIGDWFASIWAAVVGAVAWLQALVSGLWNKTVGGVFAGVAGKTAVNASAGTAAGSNGV